MACARAGIRRLIGLRRVKMSQFCRPRLHTNLDSDRFVGNNTHELIALPSFGRVLLAKRIGSRPPGFFEVSCLGGFLAAE